MMRDAGVLWGEGAGVEVGLIGVVVAVGSVGGAVVDGTVGDGVIRAASVGPEVGVRRRGLDVPPAPVQPAAANKKPTIKHLNILFMLYLQYLHLKI